jgi:hypothetical protein
MLIRKIAAIGLISILMPLGVKSQQLEAPDASHARYVIYRNYVKAKINRHDRETRLVAVLMDNSFFTKHHLTEVFRLISKRFPRPYLLTVQLSTDLWQIDTPEEVDAGATSEDPNATGTKGNHAIFIRSSGLGFFYIYHGDGRFEEVKL